MRSLVPLRAATVLVVLVVTPASAASAEAVEAPTGPTLGISAAGGLGTPLTLELVGGPTLPITFGFAPGFSIGRFHVRLAAHFNRQDREFRVLPTVGNPRSDRETVTSLLFAPHLEVSLLRGGPASFYILVGGLGGYSRFATESEPIMAPDDREVFSGFGVGAFAGFGLRFFPHPRFSLAASGGAQWFFIQITDQNENAMMPGTFGDPERYTLNSISFYGMLGATFYFGKPDAKAPAAEPAGGGEVEPPPPPPAAEDEEDDIIVD